MGESSQDNCNYFALTDSNAVFPPAGALRPSRSQPSSEGAIWPSTVTARVSTTDSNLMVGQGLSRMAIAAKAT